MTMSRPILALIMSGKNVATHCNQGRDSSNNVRSMPIFGCQNESGVFDNGNFQHLCRCISLAVDDADDDDDDDDERMCFNVA